MTVAAAKDIPDAAFLDAVRTTLAVDDTHDPASWRMRWDVQATLEAQLGAVPEKVFLAKASRLIERGVLHGCDCGCRGDYHLPGGCDGPC